MIVKWINQCKANGIQPVLATIAPVTQEHAVKVKDRMETIIEYNDWVKSYTEREHIPCLDLEAALRIRTDNWILRPDLAGPDGLHLNKQAYSVLDHWLLENIDKIIQ